MQFRRSFLRRHFAGILSLASGNVGNVLRLIERFHSCGQHLCKFIGTIQSIYIIKEFNTHRIGLQGSVQTDATTLNIVAPTMLGVVGFVLAVVCKRTQQLPTILGPAVQRGKDTTHKSL